MSKSNARARFESIAACDDENIQLDEAALVIAAETDPEVDVDHYIRRLDKMAARFEKTHASNNRLGISVSSLIDFIHESEGFSGNHKDYYAPENSYLNRVIETRQGIPITLALIHIAMGQRLEIPVTGINFPGHFLVKYGEDPHLIVDPFAGRILSEPDCATLLKQIAGSKAVLQPHYFDVAANKDILVRILDNLKQIFWREKSWDESQSCIERQLLLKPAQDEFNIQLGAVYEMQGNTLLAQHTYTQVLQGSSDEQLKNVASKRLLAMQGSSPTIH